MSWIDDPWMGFDTETTGVRALKDRLVTAALVLRIDGASYRSGVSAPDQVATWLTDPGVEIPEQATAVHGITTEQARRDGRPIEEVLHELAGSIGAVASPDAHTAEVDVAMTLDVLAGMVDQYPQLASMSALELMDYQLQAHQDWAEDFEKYLRKQGKDATIDREWPQITPRGRGDDQQ